MIISVLVVLVAVTITIIILLSITVLYFKRKMKKMTNSEDSICATVNNSHQQSHSQEIELTRNVTYSSHGMELKDNIAYQQCPGSDLNDNVGYENTQIPGSDLNDNAGYENTQIEPRASTLQRESVVDDNGGYEVIN